jgi:hypothetical protein
MSRDMTLTLPWEACERDRLDVCDRESASSSMSNFRLSDDGDDDGSAKSEPKSLAKFSRHARMRFVLE